ncbi:MAG: D-aminoacyl-tRNA deacylase [Acidobacteriota bacterium]|nr:D-aminoacyl-tRNA deacylase [Acidobacteriota bacterium]
MRALIQRVDEARVTVDGTIVGEIAGGLLVFVGIETDDDVEDLHFITRKILNLRIFADTNGKMNLSLLETGGAVLVVSQFTLHGDCHKGNRPSFTRVAPPDKANGLYQELIQHLRSKGVVVASGQFQSMMKVDLVNDGPVTLIVDSKKKDN